MHFDSNGEAISNPSGIPVPDSIGFASLYGEVAEGGGAIIVGDVLESAPTTK
ncbi:MAG: hypothetical protein IPP40_12070 [bacterium]|nr:hypothetical protein [bacterium]